MKKKILEIFKSTVLAILLSIPFLSSGQELNIKGGDKTFLPETYANSILSTHQLKNIQIQKDQPIEAILVIKGEEYIQTYGGKLNLASTRNNPNGDIELLSINRLLNLQNYKENDFKNAKFFVRKSHDKLLLDIVNHGNRVTTAFVSSINGYQFETPPVSYVKLLLNGSYILQDKSGKSNITLDLSGTVSNNRNWDKYVVESVNQVDKNDPRHFFHTITLISKKGNNHLNIALTYARDAKSWEGFGYERHKGNTIIVKKEKIIQLVRN